MSLSSALYTSVSALQGQSVAIAAVSENIANQSTTAYKTRDVSFYNLITSSGGGSVTYSSSQAVGGQGQLQSTGSTTDLAISGNGFFVVSKTVDGSTYSFNYTRNGNFKTDSDGFLINSEGYYLMGQRTDTNGNVIATNDKDINSVEPIDINAISGTAQKTANVSIDANLPADAIASSVTAAVSATGTITFSAQPADGDTVTINGQTFTFKTTASSANDIEIGSSLADTISNLASTLNASTNTSISSATYTANATTLNVSFDTAGVTGNSFTLAESGASTTVSSATLTGGSAEVENHKTYNTSNVIYDSLGISHTIEQVWEKTAANTWTLNFKNPYQTDNPNGGSTATISPSSVTIVFNGDGSLKYIDQNGDGAHDGELKISLTGFANTTGALDSQIVYDLGSVGGTDGLTQFSSNSDSPDVELNFVDQDGVKFGQLSSISIDNNGLVTALFDNGLRQAVYQVPIATFPNPNGLTHVNGTIYDENEVAGNYVLNKPGQGNAGTVSSGNLELSMTDTSTEFNKMIVAEQAYSSSSQVISTVNEMFDELIRAIS